MGVPGAADAGDGGLVLALEAEVRAVIGVLVEERFVFQADVGALVAESLEFFRGVVEAAGFGLVVDDGVVTEIEVAVAAAERLAAQRGVVEGDLEVFVEAAESFE